MKELYCPSCEDYKNFSLFYEEYEVQLFRCNDCGEHLAKPKEG